MTGQANHLGNGMPLDTRGRAITPSRLRRAMTLNTLVGAMGMAWYAVCSAQQVMQVFFEKYLHATNTELGYLVAVAQFAAPCFLLAILVYGRLRTRKAFWATATIIHRLLGFVLAGVAIWAARGGDKHVGVWICIYASAASWVLMTLTTAGWWSWMADLVPQHIRGSFFARRTVLVNGLNVVWFFAVTLSLSHLKQFDTFYVFAAAFAVGGVLGILDIVLHCLIPEPARDPSDTHLGWKEFFEPLGNRNFLGFSVAIGLFTFSVSIFGPFVAPYITADPSRHGIGASEMWLGIMFLIHQTVYVGTVRGWGILMDRFGRKPVVILGALFPVAWIGYLFLTPHNYPYILPVVALVAGLISPGYWNGVGQLMLTLTPQRNRTTFVAWHSVVVSVIAAGGSIVGGVLKDAVANFHMDFGGIPVSSIHVVALVSFALCVPSLMILGRIREGSERPVGFVLSRLATPGVFRTFLNMSTIASASTPVETARALRTLEGASSHLAVAEMVSRLEDPDLEVREEAARALGRIGAPDPAAVEALISQLRDPASSIRTDAAQALGRIGDAHAVPVLIEGLSSGSEELQDACARALEMIGKPWNATHDMRALRTIEDDSDMPTGRVIERLNHPDQEIREEAARALGRAASPEAFDALVERLRNPESTIRPDAALALGRLGDLRAVPALIACLNDPSVELQEASARALGDIGGHESVRHLLRLLDEKHPERVIAAGAEAVSKLGVLEAAWEILPRMHQTTNPVLRGQLAVAMGNLLGRPGEFYYYLTGETLQQGSRLGRLVRRARRAIETFRQALPPGSRKRQSLDGLEDALQRIRALMEGQYYRQAIEGLYDLIRQLALLVIDRDCPDDVALEYAFARDAEFGLGFWFVREVRQRTTDATSADVLHIDALLALYFLSTYRLPTPNQT